MTGEKQPTIPELWVVYGYFFFCLPIQDPYISYLFCRQPIYGLYHCYNYSYLMLTDFIGISYMRDCFCKNVTYIECNTHFC